MLDHNLEEHKTQLLMSCLDCSQARVPRNMQTVYRGEKSIAVMLLAVIKSILKALTLKPTKELIQVIGFYNCMLVIDQESIYFCPKCSAIIYPTKVNLSET